MYFYIVPASYLQNKTVRSILFPGSRALMTCTLFSLCFFCRYPPSTRVLWLLVGVWRSVSLLCAFGLLFNAVFFFCESREQGLRPVLILYRYWSGIYHFFYSFEKWYGIGKSGIGIGF